MERDQAGNVRRNAVLHFNSHAHVERDGNTLDVLCDTANFNSHAHVERDQKAIATAMRKYISTHTLTWSVTKG